LCHDDACGALRQGLRRVARAVEVLARDAHEEVTAPQRARVGGDGFDGARGGAALQVAAHGCDHLFDGEIHALSFPAEAEPEWSVASGWGCSEPGSTGQFRRIMCSRLRATSRSSN